MKIGILENFWYFLVHSHGICIKKNCEKFVEDKMWYII